jgi:hypothetical protein
VQSRNHLWELCRSDPSSDDGADETTHRCDTRELCEHLRWEADGTERGKNTRANTEDTENVALTRCRLRGEAGKGTYDTT